MKPQAKDMLVRYFVVAYALSWLVFVPLALDHQGIIDLLPHTRYRASWIELVHALGGFGPLLAAVLVLRWKGTATQRSWYRAAYAPSRMSATSWLLAFSPLGLFALAWIAAMLFAGGIDLPRAFRAQGVVDTTTLAIWVVPLFTYGFGEEAGWRGFALPILQRHRSPLRAALVLGTLWALWHLPLFFYRFAFGAGTAIGFLLGVLSGALLLTALYNRARGAMLATSCWHLTWNLVSTIDKNGFLSAFMSTVVMLVAVVLLIRPSRMASPHGPVTFPMP